MRAPMTPLKQMVMIGAIVATMLYWPLVLAVAAILALLDLPHAPVATFGGIFNAWFGMLTWWLLAFAGACIYAAFVFPWDDPAR